MTPTKTAALEALELCRQYRKTPQGDMILELMEPLVFDWFCKNEETIKQALTANTWLEKLREILVYSENELKEINTSNYTHDDVCALNDTSVEVALALREAIALLPKPEQPPC